MLALEDLKEKLSCSLSTMSPTLILSQGWEQLFKEFFAKGTQDEVYKLLPQEYKPNEPSSGTKEQMTMRLSRASVHPVQPAVHRELPGTTSEPSNTQNSRITLAPFATPLPYPYSPRSIPHSSPGNDSPNVGSVTCRGTPTFSTNVSRAIQAMRGVKKRDPDSYDMIWSDFNIFNDDHTVEEAPMKRYRRIRMLQSKNEEKGDMVKYAQRFSLVIGTQELQVIERNLRQGTCPRNITSRTIAINKLAEFLHVDRKRILDENKRRSHYVSIMERLGPGALLLLGEADGILTLWERTLKTNEVDFICNYAEAHLRDWIHDSRSLDEKAASLIMRALRGCGWDGQSHYDTPFMSHLAAYVKASNSAEDSQSKKRKEDHPETTSKRHRHDGHAKFNNHNMAHAELGTAELVEDGTDDASLDWDFDVNLNLDWDRFIEDQITEAANS